MEAIKRVQRYLRSNNDTEQALILRQLLASLANEAPFSLARLYALRMTEFELAMQLLDEWRLGRYYAQRMRLLDDVVPDGPTRASMQGALAS